MKIGPLITILEPVKMSSEYKNIYVAERVRASYTSCTLALQTVPDPFADHVQCTEPGVICEGSQEHVSPHI